MKQNNKIFAANLKKYMDKNNVTQVQLSEDLDYGQSTISDWLNEKKYPRIDALQKLADYFDVYKSDLSEDKKSIENPIFNEHGYTELRVIPLGASCGNGIINEDYSSERELFPTELIKGKNVDDYFISYAIGVSMERAGIHDNDLLLFREQPTLENGEIGLFTYNGEEFIKRFKTFDNGILLISESYEPYDPIVVTSEDELIVRAKLSKVIKDFE